MVKKLIEIHHQRQEQMLSVGKCLPHVEGVSTAKVEVEGVSTAKSKMERRRCVCERIASPSGNGNRTVAR